MDGEKLRDGIFAQLHLDHYHYKALTYDELYKLLAGK